MYTSGAPSCFQSSTPAGAALGMDHVGRGAQQDPRIAVELQGEVERRPPGAPCEGDRVLAASGDRVHPHAAALECRTHPVDDDALPAQRRIIVVAGDGDPRHRWQCGQYTVVRPAVTVRRRVVPHTKQGSPPRPYTWRRSWLLPRAFQTSR